MVASMLWWGGPDTTKCRSTSRSAVHTGRRPRPARPATPVAGLDHPIPAAARATHLQRVRRQPARRAADPRQPRRNIDATTELTQWRTHSSIFLTDLAAGHPD